MNRNSQLKNTLITAITPILWGTTYIVTTEMLPADRPLIASVIRVLPAGILLTLISRQLPNSSHDNSIFLKILVLSMLNITIFQACLFSAAYRLPGGIAAVVGSVQPLIIVILLMVIDRKKTTNLAILATLTSVIGMGMLLIKDKSFLSNWDTIGMLSALIGAVSMATGIYLSKRWKTSLHNVTNLTFTGWQLLFGGAMLLPFAMIFETMPLQITEINLIGYSYLAVFGSLLAYILWFRGIEKINPVSVSMLGALSPITATIIGWTYLGQSLSIVQMIGFVIVMVSLMVVQIEGS